MTRPSWPKFAVAFALPSDVLAEHRDEFPDDTAGYVVGPFDSYTDAQAHIAELERAFDQDHLWALVCTWSPQFGGGVAVNRVAFN